MKMKFINQRLGVKYLLTGKYDLVNLVPFNIYKVFQNAFLYLGLTERLIIGIHLVSSNEMAQINGKYRDKWKPTNILSFNDKSILNKRIMLGELVVSPEFIIDEYSILKKSLNFHWFHIMLHGFLHLLGYDHKNNKDALLMENLEKDILKIMDFEELPYE